MSERDWTQDKAGRSNSSPEFLALVDEVESMIRGSAASLINGSVTQVARLIMAQLAHKYGLTPPTKGAPKDD